MIDVKSFYDTDTNTFTYVVSEPDSKQAFILDSVLDYDAASGRTATTSADQVIAFVKSHDLSISYILETHVHADHLSAAPYLKEQLGGRIGIGSSIGAVQGVFGPLFNAGETFKTDGSQFDVLFADGDSFKLGDVDVKVVHTPGHTPACVCYLAEDCLFVGDTLFMPDFGSARCDFPNGDARQLYQSVQKIFALPDSTRMFMCHDYQPGGREVLNETSVGEQKAKNLHMRTGVSEDEFVEMREARDAQLSMPRLILPSVQVNMRAGDLPEPEDNGTRYLKIPLNAV